MLKIIKLILLSLLLLFFILFLSEFYLRFIGFGNPVIYKKSLNFGYLPKENQKVKRFKNSTVTINNQNFRTSDKNSHKRKIIFLGDSVTYGGSYIDDKELFSSKVCKKINIVKVKKYSCLNGGVNAYGFENIYSRLEYLKFNQNDIVIVTFILGNFYRNFIQIESLPYFTKRHQHIFKANIEFFSFLIDKLRSFLRYEGNKFFVSKDGDNSDLKLKIHKDIKKLKSLTRNNQNIIILFSPSKNFYKKTGSYNLESYLFQNYINNINYYSIDRMINQKLIDEIYYDNIHLNEFGHEVYSKIISKIILNKINDR